LDRDSRPEGGEWSKPKTCPKTNPSKTQLIVGHWEATHLAKHSGKTHKRVPLQNAKEEVQENTQHPSRSPDPWVGQSGPLYWGKHQRRKMHNGSNSPTGSKMNGSDKFGNAGTHASRTTVGRTVRSTGSNKVSRASPSQTATARTQGWTVRLVSQQRDGQPVGQGTVTVTSRLPEAGPAYI